MSSRAASGDADNAMWGKNGSLEMLFCALLNPAPGGHAQARAGPLRKRLHKARKPMSQLPRTATSERNLYLGMISISIPIDPENISFDMRSELFWARRYPYKFLSFNQERMDCERIDRTRRGKPGTTTLRVFS
jgi:hypothetical protein